MYGLDLSVPFVHVLSCSVFGIDPCIIVMTGQVRPLNFFYIFIYVVHRNFLHYRVTTKHAVVPDLISGKIKILNFSLGMELGGMCFCVSVSSVQSVMGCFPMRALYSADHRRREAFQLCPCSYM